MRGPLRGRDRAIGIVGVPTSAGAHWVGQERAPGALRAADLVGQLEGAGLRVTDLGDTPLAIAHQSPSSRRAQNLEAVLGVIRSTVELVDRALQADLFPLVIGGDCTITLGVVSAFASTGADPGVAYIDGSPDLNTPDDSPTGILDSMGASHLLGLGDPRLARVGPTYPMLAEDRIAFFGYTPEAMNPAEADRLSEHVARGGLACSASAARPSVGASARAIGAALAARAGTIIVQLDVDAIEAVDFPGANVPQFNTGLTFAEACQALDAFVDDPKLGAIVITEFNPDRDRAGEHAGRLVRAIVDSLRQG